MTRRKQPANALVRVDDTAQLGEAMRALPNDMMRAFVVALVTTGCSTARAAELAGYSASSKNALASRGWQLAHDPRVQAALHEEGIKSLRASGVAGITILAEIARNPQEAARDRIAAIKELMSRGGFSAVSEHNINVTHRSEQEIDAELLALATELGFSDEQKSKLLGRPVARRGKAIDAIVVDEPAPFVEPDGEEKVRPDAETEPVGAGTPLADQSGIETTFEPEAEEEDLPW
jgi:hypothetical protein